jgi:hypothetical protein
MRLFLFVFTAISLSTSIALSATSYSHLLERIQNTYLKDSAPYPVLIMDRDEIEWRFVAKNALNDVALREDIVQQYVFEKTGVLISKGAASNFEPYLTDAKDAAVAMPALKDGWGHDQKIAMCAVFPPDANRNKRLEIERILQLQLKEVYGEQSYEGLKATLSYEDSVLFSILHESGHCMDRFFFPRVLEGDEDPSTLHLSESFAETVAVFLMAKEGRNTVAETRAYLRDIYSYFMQPYFADRPMGLSAAYSYGGLIYHLAPSVRAAGAVVTARGDEIRAMSMTDVQNLAEEVVKRNSLNGRLFTALFASYKEGREVALKRYQDMTVRMPDLFSVVLVQMSAYLEKADAFIAAAFVEKPERSVDSPKELRPVDFVKVCGYLASRNYDGLRVEIDVLRQDMRVAGTPETQRKRFAFLSDLWKRLPAECGVPTMRARSFL